MTTATKNIENGNIEEIENYKFRITCGKFERYDPGAQVFIQYGKYSNRQLLTHYGFAMKDNKYNYARIKPKLRFLLNETQISFLGKGYNPDLFIVFKLKPDEICLDLLKALRAFSWNIKNHSSDSFFYCSDLRLELVSLNKMIILLENCVENFLTTIEQDENLLSHAKHRLFFAVSFIKVVYRLGVKKVIQKQLKIVFIAKEIVERLLNKNTSIFEKCENEKENGNFYSEIENNRKAIKVYTDLLSKYHRLIL